MGILSQRSITRRQVTIEHINKLGNDKDYINVVRLFIELAKANDGLAKWTPVEHEKSNEVQAIRIVLNAFELIAIGIQAGVIDMAIYKQWHKSSVLLYWKYALPFVSTLRNRTHNNNIYIEFEMLAKAFSGEKNETRNWIKGKFF